MNYIILGVLFIMSVLLWGKLSPKRRLLLVLVCIFAFTAFGCNEVEGCKCGCAEWERDKDGYSYCIKCEACPTTNEFLVNDRTSWSPSFGDGMGIGDAVKRVTENAVDGGK